MILEFVIFVHFCGSFALNQDFFSKELLLRNIQDSIGKYQSKQNYLTKYGFQNSGQQFGQNINNMGLFKIPNTEKYGLYLPNTPHQLSTLNKYGLLNSNYHMSHDNYLHNGGIPNDIHTDLYGLYKPSSHNQQQTGVREALELIARQDSLNCIAKLLCDFMVERLQPNQQQTSSILPNIDFSSVLSYLELFGQNELPTPLIVYGKAALIGYSAKGDNRQCVRAYPRCPRDPDQLVEYLNNHKGGFFRYFNGVPEQVSNNYVVFNKHDFQKRIQTKPSSSPYLSTFRNEYSPVNNINKVSVTSNREEYIYQNGKFIPFRSRELKSIKFNTQNTIVDPASYVRMIFPDRTGTGEFLLDSEKFSISYANNNNNNINNDYSGLRKIRFP